MAAPFEIGGPTSTAEDAAPSVPTFADPEPIRFSAQVKRDLADMVQKVYQDHVIAREDWYNRHIVFDQMFRGRIEDFSKSEGPWDGSSRLHVQMPYWLCDAIQSRTNQLWGIAPLVQCEWEEVNDQETARDAANLVEWHLQPKRMNARANWSRASKIRLIHGTSVSLLSHVHEKYRYRVIGGASVDEMTPEQLEAALNPDGSPQIDEETGEPIVVSLTDDVRFEEKTRYHGPVLQPLEFDDTVVPIDAMNLQPKGPANPLGADWVIVRQFEPLSLMSDKASGKNPQYPDMFAGGRDERWWVDNASDQMRTSGKSNNDRVRQQDQMEGTNRSQATLTDDTRPNPEFENLIYFGRFEHPETGREEEMVIYVSTKPSVFLGAYLLSDLVWTGDRPLLEMHYQTVSNRFYSMGVCEICEHLSEEIDTLHNMRVDVGQATNLPWAFIKASAYTKPSDIVLRPLELVPVDDPNAVVYPRFQNVTSFYHQEETLLLTIVERVMGVTDLFLGVNAKGGAAARHATGFMGTQQEAEARMSEILRQDAESFAFMCRMIYNLEMQWGPVERTFRLEGESSDLQKPMSRDDLWFRGQYDFRLGTSVGLFNQAARFQRAQAAGQILMQNPLVLQDPGRVWAVTNDQLSAMGYSRKEVESFIGPQDAVQQVQPQRPDEENGALAQYEDVGVHPSDNDREHLESHMAFMQSPEYERLGRPNQIGFARHVLETTQQMQAKQQTPMQAPEENGEGPGAGASPANRAAAQLNNVPASGGGMQEAYRAQTANVGAPPQIGES